MKAKTETNWERLLKLFSEQNLNRPTRLGVFEGEPGNMDDYWIEDGLPMVGIDFQLHGTAGPEIELLFADRSDDRSHMTRRIEGVRFLRLNLSVSGDSDGLDIENDQGQTTVLRFENGQ